MIAKHQTKVSLFLSIRPKVIRCITWPELTSQTLILSIPPVTIISSSRCHAIDRILAIIQKHYLSKQFKWGRKFQHLNGIQSCLLNDLSNNMPSIWISNKTTYPSSVPTAILVSDLLRVMHQMAPPIDGTSFLAVSRAKSYKTIKPSKPADNNWDLHHRTTSTCLSGVGTITDSRNSLTVHQISIVLSDLFEKNQNILVLTFRFRF